MLFYRFPLKGFFSQNVSFFIFWPRVYFFSFKSCILILGLLCYRLLSPSAFAEMQSGSDEQIRPLDPSEVSKSWSASGLLDEKKNDFWFGFPFFTNPRQQMPLDYWPLFNYTGGHRKIEFQKESKWIQCDRSLLTWRSFGLRESNIANHLYFDRICLF